MPEFDFSGSYVNADNVKDNDILTIVGMPVAEEKESAQQKVVVDGVIKAKKYQVLNIPIEKDGGSKTYTPDNKTGMRFVEAWGKDYTKWSGKQFSVKIEKYTAYGTEKKRVAGYPIVPKVIPVK